MSFNCESRNVRQENNNKKEIVNSFPVKDRERERENKKIYWSERERERAKRIRQWLTRTLLAP